MKKIWKTCEGCMKLTTWQPMQFHLIIWERLTTMVLVSRWHATSIHKKVVWYTQWKWKNTPTLVSSPNPRKKNW